MVTYPAKYKNAATDSVVDLIDSGIGANATLEIGDAGFVNILMTFNLQDPAFGNAGASVVGRAEILGLPISTTALATGTAAEYRYKEKDGTIGPTGTSVTASGGGGEVEINDLGIISGNTYNLTTGRFNNP